MKKNILILSLLMCFFSVAFQSTVQAQNTAKSTVSGLVIDSDSLYSISGVLVYLLDANQKIVKKTLTNTKGLFTFSEVPNGTYKIRTAASGYKIMISKKFEVVATQSKYNYKIKINNLNKGEVDLYNEMDYNEYMDLLEDREILNDDK
jgi:hypothetical protein